MIQLNKFNDRRENINTSIQKDRYYFITIRKSQVKDYVKESDLNSVYQKITKFLSIKEFDTTLDLDNTDLLHMHIICQIKKYFRYVQCNQINGYHIDYKQLLHKRDVDRVFAYLKSKQSHSMKQRISAHKYIHPRTQFGFI